MINAMLYCSVLQMLVKWCIPSLSRMRLPTVSWHLYFVKQLDEWNSSLERVHIQNAKFHLRALWLNVWILNFNCNFLQLLGPTPVESHFASNGTGNIDFFFSFNRLNKVQFLGSFSKYKSFVQSKKREKNTWFDQQALQNTCFSHSAWCWGCFAPAHSLEIGALARWEDGKFLSWSAQHVT